MRVVRVFNLIRIKYVDYQHTCSVNNATLNRFFALHFVLPLAEGNIGVLKFAKLLERQNNNNTSFL